MIVLMQQVPVVFKIPLAECYSSIRQVYGIRSRCAALAVQRGTMGDGDTTMRNAYSFVDEASGLGRLPDGTWRSLGNLCRR